MGLHSGLTGSHRPLYSAGFATPVSRPTEGPCGGTGRRARLKIEFRKECWFDSGQGHQSGIRPHPPTFTFLNNDGQKSDFWLRRAGAGGKVERTTGFGAEVPAERFFDNVIRFTKYQVELSHQNCSKPSACGEPAI